ncbi:S-layer homology domain-containing protein [Neomoorella glycerini]|nr:S-layer homology domain-containing protein [Moorella glycerini]
MSGYRYFVAILCLFMLAGSFIPVAAAQGLTNPGFPGMGLAGQGPGMMAELVTGQTFRGLPFPEERLAAVRFTDTRGHWSFLPVLRLAAQGIIHGRDGGLFAPDAPVTREEALSLLARAAGWEGITTSPAGGSPNSPLALAAARGLLTDQEKAFAAADWQLPARRQEVAAWVGRALGLTPIAGGLYPYLAGFTDGNEVDSQLAPWVEAVLQRGLMSGVAAGTFAPQRAMTRAEMAALLDRVDNDLAGRRGARWVEGQVMERTETWLGNRELLITLRVATFAGPIINLEIKKDAGGNTLADFLLYKDGRLTLGQELTGGEAVRLILQGENVLLAESTAGQQYLNGMVLAAGDKELLLVDDQGRQYRYGLSPHLAAGSGGDSGGLPLPGQVVNLAVQDGTVTRIVPLDGTGTPAYSPGDTRVVTGYLRESGTDAIVIVSAAGNEETVKITAATAITRSGRAIMPGDLKTGDPVKVQVDAAGHALGIQVGNSTGRLGRILKGKLDRINSFDNKLVLRDTREFYYGSWLPGDPLRAVNLTREAAASLAGASRDLLAPYGPYAGEVIVVLAGGPQGEVGVKAVKLDNSTRLYEGYLDFLSLGGREIRLASARDPVTFNQESIIIKNGRQVEAADLEPGDYLFTVVEPVPGGRRAVLVFTEDILPSSWQLYRGRIESVAKESFALEDVEALGGEADRPYDWQETDDYTMEFRLAWEPVIMGRNGPLSRDEFTSGRFTGEYNGYQAYTLVRGEEAHGLLLLPPSTIGPTMTSLGRLQEIDQDSGHLTIAAVRDWSPGYRNWQNRNYPLEVEAGKALVMKGRAMAALEDLAPGDNAYLIHDQKQALVVVVID